MRATLSEVLGFDLLAIVFTLSDRPRKAFEIGRVYAKFRESSATLGRLNRFSDLSQSGNDLAAPPLYLLIPKYHRMLERSRYA